MSGEEETARPRRVRPGEDVLALLPPSGSRRMQALEGMARLALTVSLSVTRAVLNVERDVVTAVAEVVGASTRAFRDTGLSRPEVDMTAEAYVTMLRLATRLSHDIVDVRPQALFDAGKAYAVLQSAVLGARQDSRSSRTSARRSGVRAALRRLSLRGSGSAPPQAPKALFNKAARYAFAAYGKLGSRFLDFIGRVQTDAEALDELTGADHTAEKQVIRSKWRRNVLGSLYRPGFYVLVDHGDKEIVLAIRGSFRLQDVVTDLVAEDVDFDLEHMSASATDDDEDDVDEDLALARELAEAESAAEGWTGFIPADDDAEDASELDAIFRNLSVALRDVRGNLNSRGDLVALQQSLQDWVSHVERANRDRVPSASAHDTGSAAGDDEEKVDVDEQAARGATRTQRAKSEVEAEAEGTSTHRTHMGFLRAAEHVAREVEDDLVEAMLANPGYKLLIVGHSLGAAVATLLTIRWGSHPVLGDATCVGIAAPCSASRDFAESDFAKARIHNVVLSDDVVPRLSLGSFTDLRDSLAYIARNDLTRTILDAAADDSVAPQDLAALLEPIYDQVVAAAHVNFKLFPPGNVWHIPRMALTLDEARLAPVTDFGTIVLSSEMFVSHLPNYYAHACIPEAVDIAEASLDDE